MRKTTVAAIQMGCGSDVKENIEKADKLAKAKNELNELKITLEKENKQQYVAEKIKLINDKALNESMLRNKRQELDERQLKIEQDSKRKNELYKKWDEISNTKLEFCLLYTSPSPRDRG